jgi:hypothetical protein
LPTEIKSVIPRSTLSNWKKKDTSAIIGCDHISERDLSTLKAIAKNRKLLNAAKSLYYLFEVISTLVRQAENRAVLLRKNKSLILDIIEKAKPVLGVKRILKFFGLSQAKFYYWLEKNKCRRSVFQLCQKRHPNQLLPGEVKKIKQYLFDVRFRNWSSLSVYYQALRDGVVFMSAGTWYKYAHRLGIRRKFFKILRNANTGIRASLPLQILHMDVTIFKPVDHTKVYIYFIVDNFSRAILGWQASLEYSSGIALGLLKTTITSHKVQTSTKLITDGGPENRGEVSGFTDEHSSIEQLIAQKDIVQSNSMVESVNKHMKYYYLFRKELADLGAVQQHLESSVNDYNNKPHGKLFGLTPTEALDGAVPIPNQFHQAIARARKERLQKNQEMKCCQEEE